MLRLMTICITIFVVLLFMYPIVVSCVSAKTSMSRLLLKGQFSLTTNSGV